MYAVIATGGMVSLILMVKVQDRWLTCTGGGEGDFSKFSQLLGCYWSNLKSTRKRRDGIYKSIGPAVTQVEECGCLNMCESGALQTQSIGKF